MGETTDGRRMSGERDATRYWSRVGELGLRAVVEGAGGGSSMPL